MATTSFLYHTMRVKGYCYLRCEYPPGMVRHHIKLRRSNRRCRGCGARWYQLSCDGRFERTFVGLPIGDRRQEIVLHGHLQLCRRCGRRQREPIPFVDGKRHFIRAVSTLIVHLCRIATVKDVAEYLGLGWGSVKEVFKDHLRCQLRKRSLKGVRLIAIDEFAIRKKQRYLTIVLNLETGEVLWSAEGRTVESLLPFLQRLKRSRVQLSAVAVDMWQPYTRAVKKVFPQVPIVHDPFHIVQLANRAIDDAQRELAARLPKTIRCRGGLRFVLLRANEHLDAKAQEILEQLKHINQPLYTAYLLKEQLRNLWHMETIENASRFLNQWIEQAMSTGLRSFRKLAKTLHTHAQAVLAWYKHPISTGPLEGLNNKAKVLKRQAYGFRDLEYFQLRLAFLHSSISRFPG